MRVSEHVEMLEVEGLHPALLFDGQNLALVDACNPNQFDALRAAVEEAGFRVADITHVLLTHQDIDHIGCVKEVLAAAPGAKVLCHEAEAPYIDGSKTPEKLAMLDAHAAELNDELQMRRDMLRRGFAARRIAMDETLRDGDVLPMAGGVLALHTPGHTEGHMCLFLEADGVLLVGDAMNLHDGSLAGPNPMYTPDMPRALKSLQRLAAYPVKQVVAYHGGVWQGNFAKELASVTG